jgi:hypothetical protein
MANKTLALAQGKKDNAIPYASVKIKFTILGYVVTFNLQDKLKTPRKHGERASTSFDAFLKLNKERWEETTFPILMAENPDTLSTTVFDVSGFSLNSDPEAEAELALLWDGMPFFNLEEEEPAKVGLSQLEINRMEQNRALEQKNQQIPVVKTITFKVFGRFFINKDFRHNPQTRLKWNDARVLNYILGSTDVELLKMLEEHPPIFKSITFNEDSTNDLPDCF